jgi:hypothetical protein
VQKGHTVTWHISIDFNVNLPGLKAFFNSLKEDIMGKLEDLKASTDASTAAVASAKAASEAANTKVDRLILAHNVMADELAALKGTIAGGALISEAEIDEIIAKQKAALADANEITSGDQAQGAETDAAADVVVS